MAWWEKYKVECRNCTATMNPIVTHKEEQFLWCGDCGCLAILDCHGPIASDDFFVGKLCNLRTDYHFRNNPRERE